MPTRDFDLEPRFRDRATGLRKAFNPYKVLDGLSVEWSEAGGTTKITIPVGMPFEDSGLGAGDLVEIVARYTDGSEAIFHKGFVSTPEGVLDFAERHTITAYGWMQDMDVLVSDKIIERPGGADISEFFSVILTDYAKRRPNFTFVRDIQIIGVTLTQLDVTNTTPRGGCDKLFEQSGRKCIWGWDVDPATGLDRAYMRLRVDTIGNQFFAGDNVKTISAPAELEPVRNAVKVQGGPAPEPNMIQNSGFEVPTIPSSTTGNMLVDGSFELGTGWHYVGGSSRASYLDISQHHASAKTGTYYVILDGAGEEIYQEYAVTPVTKTYQASLAMELEDGTHFTTGRLIVEGRNAGGAVIETYTLPLAPTTTTWTGGQASTVLANDAVQLNVKFIDATITHARFRVVSDNGSHTNGLLIDDCVFADITGIAQFGWMSNLAHPGDSRNQFLSLDWASESAAKEGAYGVRASVIATSTYYCELTPFPGFADGSIQGYQAKPASQQGLRALCWVRMAPGLNSAAGSVRISYGDWTSEHKEPAQLVHSDFVIPNDGAWHICYKDVDATASPTAANISARMLANGVYDFDEFQLRDASANGVTPELTEYLRGTQFEKYVTAEEVCDVGSDAYNSVSTWDRREAVLSAPDIIVWNDGARQYIKDWFDRNAVLLQRPRVELSNITANIPAPASGERFKVSGMDGPDIKAWPAGVTYTFSETALSVSIDGTQERPSEARLLLSIQTATGGSTVSATLAAASNNQAGGGSTSSGSGGVASSTESGTVKTTVDHADPVVYEQTETDILLAGKISVGAAAGGALDGTLPNPTIAAGAVGTAEIAANAVTTAKIADSSITSAKIVDGTIVDGDVAGANKDGTAATPSMRTLGTGAQQAAAGNDSRLSDARTPTGSINTTAPLTGGAVLSSSPTIAITKADTSHDGYLAAADWNTFNGKQAAGNYVTSLTGDVTAAGPGAAAATLAATGVAAATYGDGTHVAQVALDAKGRATSASSVAIVWPKRRWIYTGFKGITPSVGIDLDGIEEAPFGPGNASITWVLKRVFSDVQTPAVGSDTYNLLKSTTGNAAFGTGTALSTSNITRSGNTNYNLASTSGFIATPTVASGDRVAFTISAWASTHGMLVAEFEEQ